MMLLARPASGLPTVLALALAASALPRCARAHNWINNPPSRIAGLSKQVGCPARSGASINFAVTHGQDFALEWSTGHPGSYVYISVVPSSDEGRIALHTSSMLDEYVSAAPAGARSTDEGGYLSGSIYDKTHVRWTGTGPLPEAGQGDGAQYRRRLAGPDALFFERPPDWRCSRRSSAADCGRVEIGQYEYAPEGLARDLKAAYASPKYPWLKAVAKYRIVRRRPQDYDLARLALPASLSPGEYIIQYMWRGYYDCFDVLLAAGAQAPVLVTHNVWVKIDHCQYADGYGLPRNRKHRCAVVPEDGDATPCIRNCEGQRDCAAINVVPLRNPALVRFKDDVNIPFSGRRQCSASSVAAAAPSEESLVCYGFTPPADPEVGPAYTISDDPRDPVFYSTCYQRKLVTSIEGQEAGAPADAAAPPRFRFGDQCISCGDARASATLPATRVHTWRIAAECKLCSANASQPA